MPEFKIQLEKTEEIMALVAGQALEQVKCIDEGIQTYKKDIDLGRVKLQGAWIKEINYTRPELEVTYIYDKIEN